MVLKIYLRYNKNERPKRTCHSFLKKWLNTIENSWCQIQSMNVLRVIYGLDFAYSPRGLCPNHF